MRGKEDEFESRVQYKPVGPRTKERWLPAAKVVGEEGKPLAPLDGRKPDFCRNQFRGPKSCGVQNQNCAFHLSHRTNSHLWKAWARSSAAPKRALHSRRRENTTSERGGVRGPAARISADSPNFGHLRGEHISHARHAAAGSQPGALA